MCPGSIDTAEFLELVESPRPLADRETTASAESSVGGKRSGNERYFGRSELGRVHAGPGEGV